MAGGKYLQQKPQKGISSKVNKQKQPIKLTKQAKQENYDPDFDNLDGFDGYTPPANNGNKGNKGGNKKVLLIVLIAVLALIIALAVGGIIYYNTVLNMMSRPQDVTVETLSEEEINELLGLNVTEAEEVTTSPEETWPEIKSDKNITNIMVVGQATREGEDYRLSDSNILVSINREAKTVTLTSILRDLCVRIPAYEGQKGGYNRINVVYHLGSYYTGQKIDSMKMMEMCIEQNFGVKVDHTIEIDFTIFEQVVDLLGGVEVELTEEEKKFMKLNYYMHEPIMDLQTGTNVLDGYSALCYARLRKVGNGDWDRTARQRMIITQLLERLSKMGIMDIHNLFQQVLPNIVTDMSNEEITNYAFEFIPMLAGLEVKSQTIPFENTWWSTNMGSEEVPNYVLEADLNKNGKLLREAIGYVEE